MSNQIVDLVVNLVEKDELPLRNAFTEEAYTLFEQGNDLLLMYRGHPDILLQALNLFANTQNRAYFYAGASQIVKRASFFKW